MTFENKDLSIDNRVFNAGNHICKWWNQSNEKGGHWDKVGYNQGLRDCLVILQKHGLIKDYSMTDGVTMNEEPDQSMVEPYRKHSCWKCNHKWIAKVEFNRVTFNLSGEQSSYCPKCNQKSSLASAWIDSNGNPYPFPEPSIEKE